MGPSTLMETIQRLMLIIQGDQLKREEQQQHSRSIEIATLTAAVANIEKIITRPPGYSHRPNKTPRYGAGGNYRTTQRPPWPAPGIQQPLPPSPEDVSLVDKMDISAETVTIEAQQFQQRTTLQRTPSTPAEPTPPEQL